MVSPPFKDDIPETIVIIFEMQLLLTLATLYQDLHLKESCVRHGVTEYTSFGNIRKQRYAESSYVAIHVL